MKDMKKTMVFENETAYDNWFDVNEEKEGGHDFLENRVVIIKETRTINGKKFNGFSADSTIECKNVRTAVRRFVKELNSNGFEVSVDDFECSFNGENLHDLTGSGMVVEVEEIDDGRYYVNYMCYQDEVEEEIETEETTEESEATETEMETATDPETAETEETTEETTEGVITMKEIKVAEAMNRKYVLIDMVHPVKGYESYDFHVGTKCKINGYPFQIMAENGELSFEAGAIALTAWKRPAEDVVKFVCNEKIAIICVYEGYAKAYEYILPKKIRQQSFIIK